MTESLFFSQLATKSIDTKKITNSASAKLFRSDSSDFDKHLSRSGDEENRRQSKETISDTRREPKFTKETAKRDYDRSERKEPEFTREKEPAERPENNKNTTQKNEGTQNANQQTSQSQDSNSATTQAENGTEAESGTETETNDQTTEADIATDTQVITLLEGESEEIPLDALVNLAEESPELSEKPQTGETLADTAEVIPLFKEETTSEKQNLAPQLATSQSPQSTQGTADHNPEHIAASKEPRQTAIQKIEAHAEAQKATNGNKPGVETALTKLQEGKPLENSSLQVTEVKNATKNASFLGEIDVETAQKAEKTDIKARIGELSQRANAGPVSTTLTPKTAANPAQLGTAKIDTLGQAQPLSVENVPTNIQTNHSVSVRFGSLPQATQNAQIPVTTIAFHVAKSVENGVNRFEIRIDPPELGRIDVRLEVNQAGRVIANLTVERPETLDLLQRDQRALERALQDTGLDVGGESLNFSLKDQNAHTFDDTDKNTPISSATIEAEEELLEPELITGYVTNSGVDIRI